jgi:hypothetical protein
MWVSCDDSIKVFLQKSVRVNLVLYAENVEEFLQKKYLKEGYTKEQIYSMKLKTFWSEIKHIKSKKGCLCGRHRHFTAEITIS